MNRRHPPSTADWGDLSNALDLDYAFEKFAGKTHDEALLLFETTDLLSRIENLSVMPPVPFRYYMLAFKDYVLSSRVFEVNFGIDASTAASSFIDLIVGKLSAEPTAIKPILEDLLPAAKHIAEHQAKYGADEDIYGRFKDALAEIHRLATAA